VLELAVPADAPVADIVFEATAKLELPPGFPLDTPPVTVALAPPAPTVMVAVSPGIVLISPSE
jgi:hypothetical protein